MDLPTCNHCGSTKIEDPYYGFEIPADFEERRCADCKELIKE
tara:strand:+ start:4389 stop:4514 length:126 start_codon:yes stop_codon:yes gene_type:complete